MLPFLNQPEVQPMKTREITDGGSEPGVPSVAEMRESQRKGSEGKGTNDQTLNESLKDFNMGCSDCPM